VVQYVADSVKAGEALDLLLLNELLAQMTGAVRWGGAGGVLESGCAGLGGAW